MEGDSKDMTIEQYREKIKMQAEEFTALRALVPADVDSSMIGQQCKYTYAEEICMVIINDSHVGTRQYIRSGNTGWVTKVRNSQIQKCR